MDSLVTHYLKVIATVEKDQQVAADSGRDEDRERGERDKRRIHCMRYRFIFSFGIISNFFSLGDLKEKEEEEDRTREGKGQQRNRQRRGFRKTPSVNSAADGKVDEGPPSPRLTLPRTRKST